MQAMTTETDVNGADSGLEALLTLLHPPGWSAAERDQIRQSPRNIKLLAAAETLRCAQ